ncbi:MAG: hypothetical protein D6784_10360 [Chloroflexi bacterium]|nr:MAG: hypothetical protein D6784_10360 [Chloroflexota bacterium]
MKPQLQVFVADHCYSCRESRQIAQQIEQAFPDVAVEVIDVDQTPDRVPDSVFAVPTFVLDNRVVSLGNPSFADISTRLRDALNTVGDTPA